MHNNEFSRNFSRFLGFSSSFLSILFWIFLIFGFDEPRYAALTVIAAVIHETGHILYLLWSGGGLRTLRGRPVGLLLGKGKYRSYKDELALYSCGALANFAAALLCPVFLPREYAALFSTVNVATGVSNLLPVKGYDGYGILRSAACILGCEERAIQVLPKISFGVICAVCFLSLYLMDRFDGGYWIYAIFFASLVMATGKRGL